MDDAAVLSRLAELDAELPTPTTPLAVYVPCVIAGSLAFVAGQVAMEDGRVLSPGLLGDRVSVEDGAVAARRTALQALGVLRAALGGSFARLRRIVQVTVYVAATPAFVDQPKVANGASEFLVAALGDAGAHARVAIGVASLPLGAPVELALTAEIEPAG
jgi:enamine deaminase RidA (YjgF/YER057c/UK114 family)